MKKEKWIAENGSIFTEREHPSEIKKVNEQGKLVTVMLRRAIAFNVGNELAAHIVHVHNQSLVK